MFVTFLIQNVQFNIHFFSPQLLEYNHCTLDVEMFLQFSCSYFNIELLTAYNALYHLKYYIIFNLEATESTNALNAVLVSVNAVREHQTREP